MGSLYLPIHYSKALSLCLRRVARFHVALVCLVTLPRVLAGQADSARADTGAIGVRATFSVPPLELREPGLLRATWLGAHRTPPALRAAAWDSTANDGTMRLTFRPADPNGAALRLATVVSAMSDALKFPSIVRCEAKVA